jgi:cysteine desulfurase family protein
LVIVIVPLSQLETFCNNLTIILAKLQWLIFFFYGTLSCMNRIYLDNAATSWPKAPTVVPAMVDYMTNCGSNVARGGYESAYSTATLVQKTREHLCSLFDFSHQQNVVFTMNVTQSLNMLIKGLFSPSDHILVSSMEHNAVMRPLVQSKVMFDRIPCDQKGQLVFDAIRPLVRKNTKAILITSASNVCGTAMPIQQVSSLCKNLGLLCLVDSAQGSPVLPLPMEEFGLDAVCFTGHKGLLGPQGIGGLLISSSLGKAIAPLISGGTGSFSDSEDLPSLLPDRLEGGTPNLPGIIGLGAGLAYFSENKENLIRQELKATSKLLQYLLSENKITVLGLPTLEGRTSAISIDIPNADNALAAYRLQEIANIETRVGLHCAPSAHRTLGTFPKGTIRFSPGYFTTMDEIDAAIAALRQVVKEL